MCDVLLLIQLQMLSYYTMIDQHAPDSKSTFCLITALIFVVFQAGAYVFDFMMCIYLRICFSSLLKQSTKKIRIVIYSIAGTVMLGVGIFVFYHYGLDFYGFCSLSTQSTSPLIEFTFVVIYIIAASYSVVYFQKHLGDDVELVKQRKKYLFLYKSYVVITGAFRLLIAICQLITYLDCKIFQLDNLRVFKSFHNSSLVLLPMVWTLFFFNYKKIVGFFQVQSIIRLQDPSIKNRLRRVYETNRMKTLSVDNLVQQLTLKHRFKQIYTLLVGIAQIDQALINFDNLQQEELVQVLPSDLHVVECRVTLLYPNEFKQLINQDLQDISISKSFSIEPVILLILNCIYLSRIWHKCQKLVDLLEEKVESSSSLLKTINQSQKLLRPKNYRHLINVNSNFLNNTASLLQLVKYMAFTYLNSVMPLSIQFSCGIYQCWLIFDRVPRSAILMTFDLKGSEFDRESMKSLQQDVRTQTLKDTDFQKLEKKLWISEEKAQEIKQVLNDDADFFRVAKLIDYSLLVFKIDYTYLGYSLEEQLKFSNLLYILASTKEEGVYYHIGIIDYLQEWTLEKELERTGKKIINFNTSLDTSSQQPDYYADRFISKMNKLIL